MLLALLSSLLLGKAQGDTQERPNILFCIADDASWQHMSAYGKGYNWVKTPNFDRIASEGLLFTHTYTPNAKCAPSRASILTGRNPWQLEEAGNHNFFFPAKFVTFVESLGRNGYSTAYTGKGWGPGNAGTYEDGSPRQVTGTEFNRERLTPPTSGIGRIDYPANFQAFMDERPKDKPFFFWYGGYEPHRKYEYESGIKKGGKKISDIKSVPPYWIDNDVTKTDMLDYAYEVEYFDQNLGKILAILEKSGQMDNTLILVTSDNGMPFPRVKGHVFEYDNHSPLALMYGKKIAQPGRVIDDYISFIDFAPTLLDFAEVSEKQAGMEPIQGQSIRDLILPSERESRYKKRDHILLGRERTDVGRPHDQGYPVRAILKGDFIYQKNYEPSRWPSGNPETGYMDTDGSPTKTEILKANREGKHPEVWELSFGMKPAEELYNIKENPDSTHNLAYNPIYEKVRAELFAQMEAELREQGDPRMFGRGFLFDNYPYAAEASRNLYERYMRGEKMKAGWISDTDYETLPGSNEQELTRDKR